MATANQPTANPQRAVAARSDRRLAMFIIGGLCLAGILALAFIFFRPSSQPPKLAAYPGAHVLSAGDNGGEFAVEMSANANLSDIVGFYNKEFSSKGWTKLNDSVSTDEHHTSTFESSDQRWGATLDIDYNSASGLSDIGIYERKLGD